MDEISYTAKLLICGTCANKLHNCSIPSKCRRERATVQTGEDELAKKFECDRCGSKFSRLIPTPRTMVNFHKMT